MWKRLIMLVYLICIALTDVTFAHSGGTDSSGGHVCRTNCERYGLNYGQYHYHDGRTVTQLNGVSSETVAPADNWFRDDPTTVVMLVIGAILLLGCIRYLWNIGRKSSPIVVTQSLIIKWILCAAIIVAIAASIAYHLGKGSEKEYTVRTIPQEKAPSIAAAPSMGTDTIPTTPPSFNYQNPVTHSNSGGEQSATAKNEEQLIIHEINQPTIPSHTEDHVQVNIDKTSNDLIEFGLGSTGDDVKKSMGAPDSIIGTTWGYDFSSIYFDSNGKVIGWSNISKNLSVSIGAPKDDSSPFSIGSTPQQVVDAMGTPSTIIGDHWGYEYSSVTFDLNGKVNGWSDISKNLHVSIGNKQDQSDGFTIGSTNNQVVDAMGTPSLLMGSTWGYEYSTVQFDRNGRVSGWSDISGNLKIKE